MPSCSRLAYRDTKLPSTVTSPSGRYTDTTARWGPSRSAPRKQIVVHRPRKSSSSIPPGTKCLFAKAPHTATPTPPISFSPSAQGPALILPTISGHPQSRHKLRRSPRFTRMSCRATTPPCSRRRAAVWTNPSRISARQPPSTFIVTKDQLLPGDVVALAPICAPVGARSAPPALKPPPLCSFRKVARSASNSPASSTNLPIFIAASCCQTALLIASAAVPSASTPPCSGTVR